jgi:hypothetical protein
MNYLRNLYNKKKVKLKISQLKVGKSGSIYGICTGYVRDIYGTSMDQERFYYGVDREELWL